MTIYLTGYQQWKRRDALVAAVNAVGGDVRVHDIRHSANSKDYEFSKTGLIEVLGDRYVHNKGLGNKNYKGGPIALADADAGIEMVKADIDAGKTVILMCACWSAHACHRKVAGELFTARGYEVAELKGSVVATVTAPASPQLSMFGSSEFDKQIDDEIEREVGKLAFFED